MVVAGSLALAGGSLKYRRAVTIQNHRPPQQRQSVQGEMVLPLTGSFAILTGIVMLAVGERPQETLL